MFKLVWTEKAMGMTLIKKKTFEDREQRFRFILKLEKDPHFIRVIEMN